MVFFQTAIVSVVAVFLFSAISLAAFTAPQAHAYAIGSVPPSVGTGASAGANYNVVSSLQNLISPFTGFINSLKFNTSTTINSGGVSSEINSINFRWPTVNLTPVLASSAQNILSQWISQFDNWLYGATGVQFSGIMVAILGVLSWALGLAQQAVSWLLGLFH